VADRSPAPHPLRSARGASARLAGRRQEVLAALWLLLKGYRVIGFRLKTPEAEIDLLALKGRVLAVVEVKSRTSVEAALEAVSSAQRARLVRAARTLVARTPRLARLNVRLDLIALAPRSWPRHIPGAWRDDAVH
jgi:putative endonuclease